MIADDDGRGGNAVKAVKRAERGFPFFLASERIGDEAKIRKKRIDVLVIERGRGRRGAVGLSCYFGTRFC